MNALINRLPLHQRGQAWMLVSCVAYATLWISIRWGSETMHPNLIAFYRCFIGLLTLTPLIVLHGRTLLGTSRLMTHLRRSTSGVIAMFATFYAIANAPMATAMSINYAAPLFATLGAVLFLGETIRLRRMVALAAGFAGVLIVMRPGAMPLTPGIVAAMISAVGTAFSLIAIKQLTATEDPRTVVIYSFVLMTPPALLAALPHWQWPTLEELGLLLLVGLCASIGQTATVRAFAMADATAILPLDFLRFVLVILAGILLFGESFDGFTALGGIIILASTIYVAHREQVATRAHNPASQPPIQ